MTKTKKTQLPKYATRAKTNMIQRLIYRGFTPVGEQHNGFLMALIDTSKMLHRKVVRRDGQVITYLPRKATVREKQMYPQEV